jgi:hypothetical protein
MAAPGNVSDNQYVSLGLLGRAVQQIRDIAAIDDNFGLRAYFPLQLGDLFGGEADNLVLPRRVEISTLPVMWISVSVASTAAAISAASDTV